MINVIFCAYGKLACAVLESMQMVYDDANVEAVAFVPRGDANDIVEKLEKLVSIHTSDEWLIAVNLRCGDPQNTAMTLVMHNPVIRIVNGLSLPLALELIDNQNNVNVGELCEHLTTIAQQTCIVWKHLETAEEDFR